MIDDVSDIAAYYNGDPEREHHRLERHQLEWDLTWRYLERCLPPGGSILEIGAATGRYTLELARRGYTVTAVDLSAEQIAQNRILINGAGLGERVRFAVADGRDLSQVAETGFDAVLLMGPLYHLIAEADRKTALQQAHDRLRPAGLLVSAWISRFGLMGDLLKNAPAWIEGQEEARSVLQAGHRPAHFPKGGFRGYFTQVCEISPLHEALGFETITLAGVEPVIGADDASYNSLQGPQRQLWLDMLYAISAEPSLIGASRHLLYIGRRGK